MHGDPCSEWGEATESRARERRTAFDCLERKGTWAPAGGDVIGDPTLSSSRVPSPMSVAWSHVSEDGRTTPV